jgi:hypothetical protein
VVLETVDNEVGVMEGFFFGNELHILCNTRLDCFDLFGFVVGKKLSLGFGTNGGLLAQGHLNFKEIKEILRISRILRKSIKLISFRTYLLIPNSISLYSSYQK